MELFSDIAFFWERNNEPFFETESKYIWKQTGKVGFLLRFPEILILIREP